MQARSLWISGPARCGKTTALLAWAQARLADRPTALARPKPAQAPAYAQSTDRQRDQPANHLESQPGDQAGDQPGDQRRDQRGKQSADQHLVDQQPADQRFQPGLLAFVADTELRSIVRDGLALAAAGRWSVDCTTPLGFIQQEVRLFYPLLVKRLDLRPQFPIFLKSENEQELAARLWGLDRVAGGDRLVRNLLDLGQLAAYGRVPWSEIPDRLRAGWGDGAAIALAAGLGDEGSVWVDRSATALADWQAWCGERGLVSYAIATDWYSRGLLDDPFYGDRLRARYGLVLADDADELPAIIADVIRQLFLAGCQGAIAVNTVGAARSGLGADPGAIEDLAGLCQDVVQLRPDPVAWRDRLERLAHLAIDDPLSLVEEVAQADRSADVIADSSGDSVADPNTSGQELGSEIETILTISRGQMLREAAERVARAIKTGAAQPEDIAIVGPGIDALAGYTLERILADRGVPVDRLADQRPLIALADIRALLTVLALVYPGLARTIDPEAIAEMLVVLTGGAIDPVRAGAIADHCYAFDPETETPRLLPVTAFPRWDRLGYQATASYDDLLAWLADQQNQYDQRAIGSPLILLDRAIQRFLWQGGQLAADRLADVRELLEALDRYWQIAQRLSSTPSQFPAQFADESAAKLPSESAILSQFVALLRRGIITANPLPSRILVPRAVTIANIFQYRSRRRAHRWQLWLDVGSPLWSQGGAAVLLGSELFLRDWQGQSRSSEAQETTDRDRLRRITSDLLGRTTDRLILCTSDLSVSGQDQQGPLRSLLDLLS